MVLGIFFLGGGEFPSKMRQSMGGWGQKNNKITPTAKNLPKSNLYVLICLEKYRGGGGVEPGIHKQPPQAKCYEKI